MNTTIVISPIATISYTDLRLLLYSLPTLALLYSTFCHNLGYLRLGNVEFGSVALGTIQLFGSVVCGMSGIELL